MELQTERWWDGLVEELQNDIEKPDDMGF